MLISLTSILFTSFLFTVFLVIILKNSVFISKVLNRNGIPAIGGISMGSALLVTYLIYWSRTGILSWQVFSVLLSSVLILAFGVGDDRGDYSIAAKLSIQILAAVVLIFSGVRTHIVYIGTFLNIVITLLWVLAITNAFNLLDVMDGLAGSIAAIATAAFCIVSFLNGNTANAILSGAALGMLLGFLLLNLPPARVYMGNAGSHFVGFLLAAIALNTHYAGMNNKVALAAPLLILGFPIFDTAFLVLMRLIKGRSAFNKSNDHMALRFLRAGYSKRMALVAMCLAASFFAICGILLVRIPDGISLIIIILAALFSIAMARRLSVVSV
jgi:UDP-GlcNAc:undecaprenyl-phosphate GlcNAc-1-phosphate transferase